MKKLLIIFIVIITSAVTCQAHSLFIQSSRYQVSKGKACPLFFCYGHHIPTDDGVRAKKLKHIKVFSPEGTATDVQIRNETGLHSYMVSYDTPGTWMLVAETNPGFYTVYTDKKGRERHTIKPMAKIRDKALEIHTSLYSKQFTKTYVACKAPSEMPLPRSGSMLELLPQRSPFSLKPGDSLAVTVLRDGKPWEGDGTWDATYGGYSTQAEDFFHPRQKIKGSEFNVPLPNSGRWFIRYFIKTPAPASEQENYRQLKLTATLVVQVETPEKKGGSHH